MVMVHRPGKNIIKHFVYTYDTSDNGTHIQANSQHEIVVRVFVDALKLFPHTEDEFDKLKWTKILRIQFISGLDMHGAH